MNVQFLISTFRERLHLFYFADLYEVTLINKRSDFKASRILIISGGHFIHDVYSSFLAVFLPLLIAKFGLTMTLAGLLTVFFRLPSLLNPLLGVMSDRIDMRYLAIWAPFVTAVSMSLIGVAPNYILVCILLLIAGISAAVFHVLGPVMIARISDRALGRGMSFWMTAGELARTVGPLVAVGAVSFWGFEGSYPVMIVGLLASVLLFIYMKDAGTCSDRQIEGDLGKTWRALRRLIIPLTGIMISRAFMVATLVAFLPTYMVVSGKSLLAGGIGLAVLEAFGAVGTFVGGTLSDRVGRKTVLFTSMPVSSILMIAFVYATGWILFPILALLGLCLFAASPVTLAIVQDYSRNHRGTANGLYMGISFVATAAAIFFVGWFADLLGLKTALAVSALLGLSGVPIIFFLPKPQDQDNNGS